MATNDGKMSVFVRGHIDDLRNVRVATTNFELIPWEAKDELFPPIFAMDYRQLNPQLAGETFAKARQLCQLLLAIPGVMKLTISSFEVRVVKFEPEDWSDIWPQIREAFLAVFPDLCSIESALDPE